MIEDGITRLGVAAMDEDSGVISAGSQPLPVPTKAPAFLDDCWEALHNATQCRLARHREGNRCNFFLLRGDSESPITIPKVETLLLGICWVLSNHS